MGLSALPAGSMSRSSTRSKNKGNLRKGLPKLESTVCGNDSALPGMSTHVSNYGEYAFSQSVFYPAILTSSTSVSVGLGVAYKLSDLPQATALAAVFDEYKIDRIQSWMVPRQSEVTSNSGAVSMIVSAIDYDDASTPTYNGLLENNSAIQAPGTQVQYHCWKPTIATLVYDGGGTSFGVTESQWLDCASPNIQHFGLKFCVFIDTSGHVYDLVTRMHVKFRRSH